MFSVERLNDRTVLLQDILGLSEKIVGIKFLFTEKEFQEAGVDQMSGKTTYCRMVYNAAKGDSMKVNFDNFSCFGAARSLGIVDIDEYYTSGRFFYPRGLYKDMAISREVSNNITRCDHHVYGLQVGALEDFDTQPDVIIVIAKNQQMMRLIQGYTYSFGVCKSLKMMGNQAICSEATATPYVTNDMNLTMLCKGARVNGIGGENEDSLAMGIVYNKFEGLVEGVGMTITAIEHNNVKDRIAAVTDEFPIVKDTGYGVPFYGRDFEYFSKKESKTSAEEELFEDIYNSSKDK